MTAKDTSPKTIIYNQRRNKLETIAGFPYGSRLHAKVNVAGHGPGQITRVLEVGTKRELNEVEITLDR
jgi:hypothetical protein